MRVRTELKCPGCGLGTQVTFRKPSIVDSSVVQFQCENCESTVLAKIRVKQKSEGGKPNDVRIEVAVVKVSDKLLALKAEEKTFNELEAVEDESAPPAAI